MKRINRAVMLTAFTILALSLTNLAHAGPQPAFYIRTNQASYVPGDSGQLFITIHNEGDQAMTVKNITINWPWMMFLNDHWDGNMTINNINQAIAAGQAYNTSPGFTTPTDGRAYRFSSGTVKVGTDIGGTGGSYRSSSFSITMNAPTYTPVELSTSLFSILVVGILAVATFLLFTVSIALKKLRAPNLTTTH